jgi:putative transposase
VSSDRPLAEQSGQEFTSAIPTTRASDGKNRECKVTSEIRSIHSSIHNDFNQERHRYDRKNFKLARAAASTERRQLAA